MRRCPLLGKLSTVSYTNRASKMHNPVTSRNAQVPLRSSDDGKNQSGQPILKKWRFWLIDPYIHGRNILPHNRRSASLHRVDWWNWRPRTIRKLDKWRTWLQPRDGFPQKLFTYAYRLTQHWNATHDCTKEPAEIVQAQNLVKSKSVAF